MGPRSGRNAGDRASGASRVATGSFVRTMLLTSVALVVGFVFLTLSIVAWGDPQLPGALAGIACMIGSWTAALLYLDL